MADTNRVSAETFIASGDMSALQHRFVDHVGVGVVGHALAEGGMGVLMNKPQDAEHAEVALKGRVRVDAGAAVTAGDWIISAASGFGVTHTLGYSTGSAGDFVRGAVLMGRAMTSAASGSVFTLELNPQQTTVKSA